MVNYQKPKLMQPEKLILKFKLGEKSPENKREILKMRFLFSDFSNC